MTLTLIYLVRFLERFAKEKAASDIFEARVLNFEKGVREVAGDRRLAALGKPVSRCNLLYCIFSSSVAATKEARGVDVGALSLKGMLYVNHAFAPWLKQKFPDQEPLDAQDEKHCARCPRHPVTLAIKASPSLYESFLKDYKECVIQSAVACKFVLILLLVCATRLSSERFVSRAWQGFPPVSAPRYGP